MGDAYDILKEPIEFCEKCGCTIHSRLTASRICGRCRIEESREKAETRKQIAQLRSIIPQTKEKNNVEE